MLDHKQAFFHEGEVACQAEAGVDTETFEERVQRIRSPALNSSDVKFVNERTFSVAATLDEDGRPWLSPLLGRSNQLFEVEDSIGIRLRPQMVSGDLLQENIAATGRLGVLFLNFVRRRRAKSLGTATVEPDGSIKYRMHRHFRLCPKYIFSRAHEPTHNERGSDSNVPSTSDKLNREDITQLESADIVFLTSYHEGHGVDATLRGGPAGFVKAGDNKTLTIPDYLGNGMFNTLGNLRLYDRLGFLCVDFRSGRTIHLTGRAVVEPSPANDELALRTIRLSIDEVRTTWPDVGVWTDIEAYPHAPNLVNPLTPML